MSTNEKIRFACLQCGRAVEVAMHHAGKQGKCPACGHVVSIPRNRLEILVLEQQKKSDELAIESQRLQQQIAKLQIEPTKLSSDFEQGRTTVQRLRSELASLEENLEDISYGLYKPHFTYDTSEKYKATIRAVRDRQKQMVRAGLAASCSTSWTVGESRREGERMTKQYLKLLLRAFNGESDAAVANVAWSNYRVMENRIRKAKDSLNKTGEVMHMSITDEYVNTKIEELRLVFEHEEKKQQEREEQRRLRAQMKEEEKAQREFERARLEAEKEEITYEKALAEVQREADAAIGAERDIFNERIAELEQQLAEAHAKKERAISRAQMTRSGHVYIISNLGSFGDSVFKIGMTRRDAPHERIRELGDASVPFPFDIHGMIYCDDAPEVECALHTHFWDRRINRSNDRKEFFRIDLQEIDRFVKERGLELELSLIVEAKEYRQTLVEIERSAAELDKSNNGDAIPVCEYPEALFPV